MPNATNKYIGKVIKTFVQFRENDYLCIVILINNLFTLKTSTYLNRKTVACEGNRFFCVFVFPLLLMLLAKQVIHGLYGVERTERHFHEYGVPVAHCSVP